MNSSKLSGSQWRKKLLYTPVSQLLRGRITGPLTLLEMLDTSAIPETVVNALDAILKQLPRRLRSKATRQLVKSCKEQLQAGRTESQLLNQLSDSQSIASLIRKTGTASWVLETSLPANLWPTVISIVEKTGKRKTVAQAVVTSVCRGFQSQLDAGKDPEELMTQYGDTVAIGKLIQQTKSPEFFLADDLPENVVNIVLDVVRRTRLWSTEKADTAQELFAHFADGLKQGSTPDELIESFGSPKISAKLIRRATIRKRPLAWHIWHRTRQSIAVFAAIIVIGWTVLAARFMLAKPTIKFDLVQQHDDESRTIPTEQRAWPLYRRGIVMLIPPIVKPKPFYAEEEKPDRYERQCNIIEGLSDGPESKYWAEAKAYLLIHADALEIFLEATTRPQLGFINRDPGNKAWLMAHGHSDSYEYNPPEVTAYETLLLQVQDLQGYVSNLLTGALYLAAEQGNGERCLQLLQAKYVIASHIRQTFSCLLTHLITNGQISETTQKAMQILIEKPEIFNDAQVETLFKEIADTKVETDSMASSEWAMILDVIQKTYSDDGNGNGRFTLRGFQFLLKQVNQLQSDSPEGKLLKKLIAPSGKNKLGRFEEDTEKVSYQIMVAPLAAVIANRKEMLAELLILHKLLREVKRSEDNAESEYMSEYQRLLNSPHLRLKYLPALFIMPGVDSPLYFPKENPGQVLKDAALITIAAELYRRQHGEFPATAAQLVPAFLPEIPIDPYTDKPLRYSLKEGRPHIDSEGLRIIGGDE